jgi:hypothetical protein
MFSTFVWLDAAVCRTLYGRRETMSRRYTGAMNESRTKYAKPRTCKLTEANFRDLVDRRKTLVELPAGANGGQPLELTLEELGWSRMFQALESAVGFPGWPRRWLSVYGDGDGDDDGD